jgi:hypothetical protein
MLFRCTFVCFAIAWIVHVCSPWNTCTHTHTHTTALTRPALITLLASITPSCNHHPLTGASVLLSWASYPKTVVFMSIRPFTTFIYANPHLIHRRAGEKVSEWVDTSEEKRTPRSRRKRKKKS